VLDDPGRITAELREYRQAGGAALLDCQPPGCGRDGRMLAKLSRESGVDIAGCTGFHRARYYPPDCSLWGKHADAWTRLFIAELQEGMRETLDAGQPVRAAFIKVAVEAHLEDTPQSALEAAAAAAAQTGCMLQAHTEKGAEAERVLEFFTARGVNAGQVVLCHVDKRPDFGLHSALARAGALLEYDTFYRPKYHPEDNLWPLIAHMAAAGLHKSAALATDMAESTLWKHYGGWPGLANFPTGLRARLVAMGLDRGVVEDLTGRNCAVRLAAAIG
jgi:phosphotriesterase-related protein